MDRSGSTHHPINTGFTSRPYRGACHEWWANTDVIAFIDYETGVHEVDLSTGSSEHVWKEPLCHAHSDPSHRYYVADQSPYTWADKPCQVLFFDRKTGRRVEIASGLPQPPGGYANLRSRYHVDPHPQFAGDHVVWTSTVNDRITVALTPMSELL